MTSTHNFLRRYRNKASTKPMLVIASVLVICSNLLLIASDPDPGGGSDPENPPPSATVAIGSPSDGDIVLLGSTASATATSHDQDRTGDIIWGGDVSGTGATSSALEQLGEATITADLDDASDEITVSVVDAESLMVEDTSTSAGTRTSEGYLIMVSDGGNREAKLTFTYANGSNPGNDYPIWTCDPSSAISASSGDLEATFDASEGEYTINAEFATGETRSMSIDIIDDHKISISIPSETFTAFQDTFNSRAAEVFSKFDGQKPTFSLGGKISGEGKLVDYYNDASTEGLYGKVSGEISAKMSSIDIPELVIPVPGLSAGNQGVRVTVKAEFTDLEGKIGGELTYDQSVESPFQSTVKLSGSTGIAVTVKGAIKVCSAETGIAGKASTLMVLTGSVQNSGTACTLKGNIKVDVLTIEVYVFVETPFGQCQKEIGDPVQVFDGVNTDTPEVTVYDFADIASNPEA